MWHRRNLSRSRVSSVHYDSMCRPVFALDRSASASATGGMCSHIFYKVVQKFSVPFEGGIPGRSFWPATNEPSKKKNSRGSGRSETLKGGCLSRLPFSFAHNNRILDFFKRPTGKSAS